MDLNYPPEAEAFRSEVRAWLEDNLPEGWGSPGFRMTAAERVPVLQGMDSEARGRGLDLRLLAEGVRGSRPVAHGERGTERGVRKARTRRCGRTSSATLSSGRRSSNGAPRSRSASSCRRSSTVRSRGARGSPSPTQARISLRSRPAPSSTATNGSSTARRSGRPRHRMRTTSSCSAERTPTRRSTRASPTCSFPCARKGSR